MMSLVSRRTSGPIPSALPTLSSDGSLPALSDWRSSRNPVAWFRNVATLRFGGGILRPFRVYRYRGSVLEIVTVFRGSREFPTEVR